MSKEKLFFQTPNKWEDSNIERHDRFNVEIKLDYQLHKDLPTNTYELETYFFIPTQLQINKKTYSNKQFFSNLNNYLRFKTPEMAISGIINPDNKFSPLNTIKDKLTKLKDGVLKKEIVKKIKYELKLLANIIKASIRDQFDYYFSNFESIRKNVEFEKVFVRYLQDIKVFRKKILKIREDFITVQIPQELRDAYRLASNYISLQIEERLTKALDFLQGFKVYDNICNKEIIPLINFEHRYQEEINSKLIIEIDSENKNENFVYWGGLLKKFVQNILYLNIRQKDEKSKTLRFLYAFAAGLAMFSSLLFGFLLLSNIEKGTTFYITALVVIYILKDQIKDIFRNFSGKFVENIFPDRKFEIHDALTDKKIGTTKESMRFIKINEIPLEILKIRKASNKSLLKRQGKPESIFKYNKIIELKTDKIMEYHNRHGDINDIIRFNIRNFLLYADDSIQKHKLWDEQSKKIHKIKCSKVYHINIVLKINSSSENPGKEKKTYFKKIRVVVTQQGIKRIVEPTFTI